MGEEPDRERHRLALPALMVMAHRPSVGVPKCGHRRDKARDNVHVCGREGVAERTEGGPPPQKAQMQNTNVIDTHRPDRSQREL